jgi:bifunctional non-homologous end joining protein LigD
MLNKYHKKRNFKDTPEPEGKVEKTGSKLRFVIQKHAASQLHFDLRLESEGVMKSWAVPKGPSLNPKERRLAMEVEDHPIEYNKFEGTIPEGNYGAGTVMIWDHGYYEPIINDEGESNEEAVIRHLKDGHLKFRLFGKKLHGEFAIFKIKPKDKFGSKDKNVWLLIKHSDEFANKAISHQDVSVVSGRTLDEIAEDKPKQKVEFEEVGQTSDEDSDEISNEGSEKTFNGAVNIGSEAPEKSKFPESVSPMLATLADEPFNSEDWLYELKWDGYRALAQIRNGKVRLYSRNDQDFNNDYPEVVKELESLPGNIVLDGEVVAVDEDGVSRFQLLQNKKSDKDQKVLYYVFDILYFDKFDLRGMAFEKRLEILKQVVKPNGIVRLSETYADGIELFKSAKHLGMEGIIAKRKECPYREGRSSDWLKIKAVNEQEFVIGGYTEPKGQRKRFGSILIGEYVDKEFVYRGHVGTGFNTENMKELQELMDEYEVDECPFKDSKLIPRGNVLKWIKPKVVVQVKFSEWTDEQILRHPVYLGIRKDKKAKEVVGEKVIDASSVEKEDSKGNSTLPDLEFSNLGKIYWPKEKYTKGDLLEYYNDIGDVMMPYLVDRPQNMNRHPNGIKGESFYQKDFNNEHPDYVTVQKVYSESTKKYVDYILCQNKETLLFLANLGCIEINPWNSKIDTLENPDYILFDLDPVEVDFDDVVKVAREINELCEELDIPSFCKTSGKRGLHIYLPLGARYDFEQIKIFAELIAVKIQNRLPKIVSLERSPDDRKGKVYIDYLQNRKGQTTACAYSVRPTDGATVSTPLKWDEVNGRLDPKRFNIKNMRERLDKVGDLWEGVLGEGIDIVKVLKKLS